MRRLPARESHGAALVLQSVAGFVRDVLVGGLQRVSGGVVPAALDDEVRDHAMDQGAGVEPLARVAEEVRRGEGRPVLTHLDDELAQIGDDLHLRVRLLGARAGWQRQGEQQRREHAGSGLSEHRVLRKRASGGAARGIL